MFILKKDELEIATVKNNYFPLILDENLTPEKTEESLLEKLKICKVDMRTHYPKLYDYLLKVKFESLSLNFRPNKYGLFEDNFDKVSVLD